jgi:CBS domain-containing protein
MDLGLKVGDLMTRDFIFVSLDTNLKECARMMVKKKVGSLIVKEKNKLRGILTEKDIVWALVKQDNINLKDVLAKDLMKRKVVTIKPSADIVDALKHMRKYKVRRLPVLENGKLIGLITWKDILKFDPNLFEVIAETVKIKDESEKLAKARKKLKRKHGICEICGELDMLYRNGMQWICEKCKLRQKP